MIMYVTDSREPLEKFSYYLKIYMHLNVKYVILLISRYSFKLLHFLVIVIFIPKMLQAGKLPESILRNCENVK